MTPEERAAAIAAAVGDKTLSFSQDGISFSVSGVSASGSAVLATITAYTGNGPNRVWLPLGDNQFRFVNPPLAVPDGGFDAEGRKTFVRNDIAAAKQIVYDAAIACALHNGWTP